MSIKVKGRKFIISFLTFYFMEKIIKIYTSLFYKEVTFTIEKNERLEG